MGSALHEIPQEQLGEIADRIDNHNRHNGRHEDLDNFPIPQPHSLGGRTVYYYCCYCRHGPQVLSLHPICSYCNRHQACQNCTYVR